jgi:TPR repeat protein
MLREEQGASEEAEGWYRRAAEAGHEAAARKLGIGQATA